MRGLQSISVILCIVVFLNSVSPKRIIQIGSFSYPKIGILWKLTHFGDFSIVSQEPFSIPTIMSR